MCLKYFVKFTGKHRQWNSIVTGAYLQLTKNRTWLALLSCEFNEIFQKGFFYRKLPATTSPPNIFWSKAKWHKKKKNDRKIIWAGRKGVKPSEIKRWIWKFLQTSLHFLWSLKRVPSMKAIKIFILTHFMSLISFYTPLKTSENQCLFDVFRGS